MNHPPNMKNTKVWFGCWYFLAASETPKTPVKCGDKKPCGHFCLSWRHLVALESPRFFLQNALVMMECVPGCSMATIIYRDVQNVLSCNKRNDVH